MLILHQGPAAFGIGNVSPFCLKLESYLRMTGIPYEVRAAEFGKSPKGKIPFIEEDGSFLGDSQLIIEHLKRTHGDALDAKLGTEDIARGHLVRRVLEESLYWHIIQERWVSQEGWRLYKPIFEALFPPVVGKLVVPMVRRGVIKAAHTQGLGRHRPEEILEMGKADVSAVATTLGDKPYLLGEQPTSFDAALYAFIVSIIAFPVTRSSASTRWGSRTWSATASASSSASSRADSPRPDPRQGQVRSSMEQLVYAPFFGRASPAVRPGGSRPMAAPRNPP